MSKPKQPESSSESPSSTPDFERALAELESIVARMETGELTLEQSLIDYKRGAELLQLCQQSLAEVEQQVRILNEAKQLSPYQNNDE